MADISALGALNPAQPLDLSQYVDAVAPQGIPPSGRYTVRAPESFSAASFSATKAGFLSAQIDPTIVGPSNEGYTLRYTKLSAKTYDRKGSQVSQVGDYLRAVGVRGAVPAEPQQIADAIEATAGAIYEVDTDWEARYRDGFEVKGMRNFPCDAEGNPQPWVLHPTEKGVDGNPLRLRANLVVRRFIAQD